MYITFCHKGLCRSESIPGLEVKKTMSRLVLFVSILECVHAPNSFSVILILDGTSPFTTDFYQNHQIDVIEQQAALSVLDEKERAFGCL